MGGFCVIAVVALLALVAGDVTKIHFEMHERKENQTAVSIEEGDTLVVTFFCILTTGYAWKLGNSASPTPSAYGAVPAPFSSRGSHIASSSESQLTVASIRQGRGARLRGTGRAQTYWPRSARNAPGQLRLQLYCCGRGVTLLKPAPREDTWHEGCMVKACASVVRRMLFRDVKIVFTEGPVWGGVVDTVILDVHVDAAAGRHRANVSFTVAQNGNLVNENPERTNRTAAHQSPCGPDHCHFGACGLLCVLARVRNVHMVACAYLCIQGSDLIA